VTRRCAPQNENACGLAAQNEDEDEVEVEDEVEDEVEVEVEGEVEDEIEVGNEVEVTNLQLKLAAQPRKLQTSGAAAKTPN
jgi:hypothetical protein